MTESRIFHVESDEIAQSGDFDLFERLKNNEKPITDTEINIYVDGLVKVLKKISKNKERKSLLQKIFSVFESNKGLSLKKTVILRDFPSDSNNYSYEMGLERIRAALLEKLKDKLAKDPELANFNYSDILVKTNSPTHRLSAASDMNNRKKIEREVREDFYFFKKELIAHQVAMQKLQTLKGHKNVVKILGVDNKNKASIAEKLNLRDLFDILTSGKVSLKEVLKIVSDCISGAIYLKENDLVMQDIAVPNLGVVNENGAEKGVLFDMDGLYVAGEEMFTHISHGKKYETHQSSSKVEPAEMTEQFAVCLQKILGDFSFFRKNNKEKIKEAESEIHALIDAMVRFDSGTNEPFKNRITLEEAKQRLDKIISSL